MKASQLSRVRGKIDFEGGCLTPFPPFSPIFPLHGVKGQTPLRLQRQSNRSRRTAIDQLHLFQILRFPPVLKENQPGHG